MVRSHSKCNFCTAQYRGVINILCPDAYDFFFSTHYAYPSSGQRISKALQRPGTIGVDMSGMAGYGNGRHILLSIARDTKSMIAYQPSQDTL